MNNYIFTRVSTAIIISILITSLSFAQNWHIQNSNTIKELEGIHMITSTEGWICGDDGVMLHTTNSGDTWTVSTLTSSDLNQIVFKDASNGIVVGDDGEIFTTTNGGTNWILKNSGTNTDFNGAAYAGNSTYFAVGDTGVAFKSTDNGNTWISLNTSTVQELHSVAAIDQKVWIGARNGLMLFSSNGGTTFASMSNPASDDIKDIQFIDASTGFACGSNSFFMFTSDGGTNWVSRSSGIQHELDGLHFVNQSIGWVVGDAGNLYSTTNAGLNWIAEQSQTIQDLNSIHSFDGINVWGVGEFGVIITNYSSPSGIDLENNIAFNYNLEQNYPNPFNPSTTIWFSIPASGFISLKVYNTLGVEVKTLVNQVLSAGSYSIEFNADGLNSGVLFYTLSSNNFKYTRKMILTK